MALALAVGPLAGCVAMDGEDIDVDDTALDVTVSSSFNPRTGLPVIFVHGCTTPDATDAQAVTLWDNMKSSFATRGYPSNYLVTFLNQEEQCTSNARMAAQLSTLIDQTLAATGKKQVNIVAHSMGGLFTRYYFATQGTSKVAALVTLGGAHHGTAPLAIDPLEAMQWQDAFGGYPWFEGVQEMYPPYACAGQTWQGSQDVQFAVNGCLTPTGRKVKRDETPGSVRYLSIRNTMDEIVDPVPASCLNQNRQNDCSDSTVNDVVTVPPGPGPSICAMGCPAHLTMLFNDGVIQKTYAFLNP